MTDRARRVYIKLVLAFALTFLIAPVAAWLLPTVRWHRVATRTFLILMVLLFAYGAGHPRTWIDSLRAMGLNGPHRFRRQLVGFLAALVVFAALLGFSWIMGARGPSDVVQKHGFLKHLGLALLTGFLVSLFEEPLCRGYLKDTIGGPASAFLYAIAHYFRPMGKTQPTDGFEPLLVVDRFPELMAGWMVKRHVTWGILSLFLLGLALNRLRDRTGTLYVGIGLHMGLVFGMKFYTRFVSQHPNGSDMIWGWNRLHDGLVGTVFMGLLLLAAYRLPMPAKLLDGTEAAS